MKKSLFKISAFVLFVIFLSGCNEQFESPIESVQWDQPPGITIAIEKLQGVMDIQDQVTDALFRNPEVVGTGTGVDANGNPAIVVYTLTKVEQRADITIENVGTGDRPTALPVSIKNIPVVPKVTGMFKAYAAPTARFDRPVPIGVSTGHPDITAGTIGCRVKDGSGNVYALSNNHVYANSNNATIGDNVLQPGTYDGGTDPADAIGTLYAFEPINFDGSDNYIDAAIASVTTNMLGTSTPSGDGYGTPSTTYVSASLGQTVQKYGRTTGWTHGEISEINVMIDVCYEARGPFRCVKSARFVDQISIIPGSFSDGGDSGSLIVTDDANQNAVGLLFAGSTTNTIANPIGVVLNRFKVSIDDGSSGTPNVPPTADFTYTTSELTASFTDESYDSDGSVDGWNWKFGDGSTSEAQNPSHTYTADGTYPVSLTVTDNDGATGTTSQNVTVSTAPGGDITLTAIGYKVRGVRMVDLEWGGATGTQVNIYRNGTLIITTENDGFYTDNLGRNSGTYIYQVCETAGSACSNDASVIF